MASPTEGFVIKLNQPVNFRRLTTNLIFFPKNLLRFDILYRLNSLEMASFTGHPYMGVMRHFFIMPGVAFKAIG